MATRPDGRDLDVAVVIVTYKTADLTIQSIKSIEPERAAGGLRIRVLVVDNASGDAPALAHAIEQNGWSPWVTLISAPRNGGFAYGNNLGIERAYSVAAPDYIYLLNPDTQVRSGAISALARFLEEHPSAGIAGSAISNEDGTDWPIAFRFPGLLSELESALQLSTVTWLLRRWKVVREMRGAPEQVDWICGASMMIRPEVIASVGGLDENYFLYFEETDFCYRAKCAGFSTWYVPAGRVMHIRGQSTSVTDLKLGAKRLPFYWFESRRRYFARTYGIAYAVAIDLIALLGNCIGVGKRRLLSRRGQEAVPYFIRDLASHSVIRPRNWSVPEPRVYVSRMQCRAFGSQLHGAPSPSSNSSNIR